MGGKGSGGARRQVRPDDKRQTNAGPPASRLNDPRLSSLGRLALDLGFTGRRQLLEALGARYDEQPDLVRSAFMGALRTADEW